MKTTNTIVLDALARYLDLEPSTIHSWQHLEVDLYMSPADLVLVLGEVEDVEDVALPIEQLASMATVGDLQSLVARTLAREKPARSLDRVA